MSEDTELLKDIRDLLKEMLEMKTFQIERIKKEDMEMNFIKEND